MGSTSIEWTNETWNPVRGCKKVSPGCKNCYAETFAERWRGVAGHPYEQGFDLRLVPEKLQEPLHWREPRRVFVNSMSDLFQDGVPFEFIDQAFAVMALSKRHTFQILTKRPRRMQEYVTRISKSITPLEAGARSLGSTLQFTGLDGKQYSTLPWPIPNVWLGVSVENQDMLERVDILKDTDAAVHFVSFEPLLEHLGALILDGIQWAIVGGESGPGCRPCDRRWIYSIIDECRRNQVACFVKQLGKKSHIDNNGSFLPLHHPKGGDPMEWPPELRIREFPKEIPA